MMLPLRFSGDAVALKVEVNDGIEVLGTGFRFLEGPAWNSISHELVFSDIPGNALYTWSEVNAIRMLRQNSFLANGNAFDNQGNLITCEHGTSSVSLMRPDGTREVLAHQWHGKELNSPNDVVVAPDNSYVFTDPPYGRFEKHGIPRKQCLSFQGVFRIAQGQEEAVLLVADFDRPNGLCFSLDRRHLFIDDTSRFHIRKFAVNDDGSISGGTVWTEIARDLPGAPDGMCMSEDGTLWCTGPGGVLLFDETGKKIGMIALPEVVANVAWGGLNGKELFVTASTSLYRIRTRVRGDL